MKTKSLGMRPKTLRSGIRSTPATLHLEITMLLHQQRRLHSELASITERSAYLQSLLEQNEQRINDLTIRSDGLDPEGQPVPRQMRPSPPSKSSKASGASALSDKEREKERATDDGFRHMSLSY